VFVTNKNFRHSDSLDTCFADESDASAFRAPSSKEEEKSTNKNQDKVLSEYQ
jgi:hypothetical protein